MHKMAQVPKLLSGNHHEEIQFHILKTPSKLLILGNPWFRRHNNINWETEAISGWGPSCPLCYLKHTPSAPLTILHFLAWHLQGAL